MIVVSLSARRLWYLRGDSVAFTAPVAVASGGTLTSEGGDRFRFITPKRRYLVERKDMRPLWVPPDWHFVEQAKKRHMGLIFLKPTDRIVLADSAVLTMRGANVVRISPSGEAKVLRASDGKEIVANGKIVVPPEDAVQRSYPGVLGTRRLYLGHGYGIHGTNQPSSIGRAVTHGCIRLRNSDIEALFPLVDVGTAVYVR